MLLAGNAVLKCNSCGREYQFTSDDFWEEEPIYNGERNMGPEFVHPFSIEVDCECGESFSYSKNGVEYPPEGFEYEYPECHGCTAILEPYIIMDDLPEAILSIYEQVLVNPRAMYDLEPWQFENFVADVFSRNGFKVRVTQKTRDGGKDIVATFEMGGILYNTYFECKKYAPNRPVDVAIVREEYAVMQRDHIDKAIIVTTSRFTRDAKREADIFGIGLVDYDKLLELMQKARREPQH